MMFKSVEKNLKHYDVIWEDREFRYDVDSKQLKLRNGEFIVDKLHGIENTKGNREHKEGKNSINTDFGIISSIVFSSSVKLSSVTMAIV
ncbi:Bardet-Biedl syndrome 5 -like protein [Trichinella sp. T9]|nr:Bardet-Biedl syndrome 5 -like protein [Trichinella sp. T9]KRX51616.1 Bardet-Biedl syndrome 5 -like protein [Trichinella sp. T9]